MGFMMKFGAKKVKVVTITLKMCYLSPKSSYFCYATHIAFKSVFQSRVTTVTKDHNVPTSTKQIHNCNYQFSDPDLKS